MAPWATMGSASAIVGTIQRKMHGPGVVRAEKEITLVISNEDIDDIIRTIIDGVRETTKHEIKKQEHGFLGMLLETSGESMLGNILMGKGVTRAGKGTMKARRG